MLLDENIRTEVEAIANNQFMPIAWDLKAHLIVNGGEVYEFENIASEKYSADFATDCSAYHFIMTQIPITVYRDTLVPFQNSLRIRLSRTQKDASGKSPETITEISDEYLAFLVNPQDINKLSLGRKDTGEKQKELGGLVPVYFQLIDEEFYYQFNKEVGGIYEGRPETVLFNRLLTTREGASSTNGLDQRSYKGIRGLDAETFQNDRIYDNIVIKGNVRLKGLTKYIQEHYGISTFGINTFWQSGMWYTYPLFKHNRFSKRARNLTIYNIPEAELPSTDKSYVVRDESLHIISTGKTKIKDESVSVAANVGTALRMTPASFYDQNFYEVGGNKVKVKGSENARTYASKKAGHGVNNVRYSDQKFNANPYPEISALNASQGGLITLSWHNADRTLLYPGMPAKIYYVKPDGMVTFVYGTLLAVMALTTTAGGTVAEDDYRTSCELTFHFKEEDED